MKKHRKEIIGYCVLIGISIVIFLYSNVYKANTNFRGDPSSSMMPQISAVVIGALSLIQLIGIFLKRNSDDSTNTADTVGTAEASAPVQKEKKSTFKFDGEIPDFWRGIGSIVLLFFLVIAFEKLGFIITLAVYLFFQQLLLTKKGERHWIRTVLVAIIVPTICYFVFVKALNYMLPLGPFR